MEENKNSKINSRNYVSAKNSDVIRFLDTIDEFGGELKILCDIVPGGHTETRRLYVMVRGEKENSKQEILNLCLIICGKKWRKINGGQYEPSTWYLKVEHLFPDFKANSIQYDPTTDFNGKGEFHSCLNFEWKKELAINRDYGTSSCDSKFDFKGDTKIRLAVKKNINPYDDYDDLINIIVFLCGRCFLLRGGREI